MKSLFNPSLPKKLVVPAAFIALACLAGCAEKPKSPAPAAKAETPKTEAPKSDAPKPEAVKTEAPKAETAKTDAPKPETPKASPAKADANAAPAAFWPRFHGPNNDNISTEKGLLKKWPDGGPKLLWTAKGLGVGWSSVSIAGGRIYTAGDVDKKTNVFALSPADGNPVWKKEIGPGWTGAYPGSHATPTLDGDRLYFESATGDVVCMNPADGAIVWSKNILKEFESDNIGWGLAESVLIDGDRLICCPGGPKASVVALDKKNGNVVWAAKPTTNEKGPDKANYATPMIGESQGLRMILTMNQQALIGVAADNGELLFRHDHKTMYDINATTPVLVGDQVFITSGYRSGSEMLKLTVSGRKVTVERLWENKKLDNQHGGVVVLDGHIYGASHQSRVGPWLCLNWSTGKETFADGAFKTQGPLTYADGMLYVVDEKAAEVGLVEATPVAFKVVSRFKLPEGGDGPAWAHPVVAGGRLYLRHGEFLYAYDIRQ